MGNMVYSIDSIVSSNGYCWNVLVTLLRNVNPPYGDYDENSDLLDFVYET